MIERLLPQRFCPPSDLGNPQKTRVSTFPQRRRLLLSNWTQLLNPRKSNVSTDSRPEPQIELIHLRDNRRKGRCSVSALVNFAVCLLCHTKSAPNAKAG